MAKHTIRLVLLLSAFTLQACSSSKVAEDAEAQLESTEDIASTDTVPSEKDVDDLDQLTSGVPASEPVVEGENMGTDDSQKAGSVADQMMGRENETAWTDSSSGSSNASGSGDVVDYKVRAGDTLMKIAFENYGDVYSWRKIYDLNRDHVANMSALSAGMTLKIEKPADGVSIDRNGESYLIKTGDTLGTISGDVYGTQRKWRRLFENNRQLIKNPNRIYAGFYLYYTFTEQDRTEKEQSAAPTMSQSIPEVPAPAAPVERSTSSLSEETGATVPEAATN